MTVELKDLTAAGFNAQVGHGFSLSAGDGQLSLQLIEVKQLGSGARPGGAFSLLFEGPHQPLLEQATYSLADPNKNTIDLFLVPVNQTEDASFYEAVFT